jgi:hypothetical protein
MAAEISFRPADETDSIALTELALRAKSHWGYEGEFLEAARPDLTITEDTVLSSTIVVL